MHARRLFTAAAAAMIGAALPVSFTAAQEAPAAPFSRISGLMFGDFYWIASNHEAELEGRNGWWFRRVYITLDQDISNDWTTRTRVEFNQPGDFQTNAKMEPILKDIYVQGTFGLHSLQLGLVPTPTFESYEKAWGYRSVEKSPLDLYRFGASRDVGFAIKGAFSEAGKLRYHLLVGNGSDTGTEIDKGKNVALALALAPVEPLTVEVYADVDGVREEIRRRTVQGAVYYAEGLIRGGLLYAHQIRSRDGAEDVSFDIASLFGSYKAHKYVSVFARVDRQFQVNPNAHAIAYFRFAENTETNLFITGLDVALNENVHLMPNLEVAHYDRAPPSGRRTDVMPRMTLFYQF